MLVVKAFHIIAVVAWFAGLFYLPRLFVYHAEAKDRVSIERFKIMERRLYYGITWPAALLTTGLGIFLIFYNPSYYLRAGWMHAKISLVVCLWIYHVVCGQFVKNFANDINGRSSTFYRIFNELPTLLLIAIVLLVVVKPF
ncbi:MULTISPECIES: protoporphyrinogen oxidase HemJ [Legionella]|uniref:Protoporphyrinogen IX oxidase n=1 Tax=Legionella septentrionalis TaxID=2498109 RepID=A0A433JIJ1_9GAMM|nr:MULTISPECIES: protoporphyrinogen oxidase HemJ [Legionella]MCP0913424.1 protoporphyrinogen oxidase HemJ [Legionella sp. 27cVA30]RUQ84967.1 protoporphyrinogen oxidase HemJ [Legionella septentrionalis]RUQ99598.1 protoporphyrinogen oxidase HemJ [Legionella septentrionalis]RUR09860.1 protoporphyrinogen oxidase HemJ [Legionella septentrionalis]RUR13569.1 protoporphyrinogen oxidase HemJ [Legionella septentrionalis]